VVRVGAPAAPWAAGNGEAEVDETVAHAASQAPSRNGVDPTASLEELKASLRRLLAAALERGFGIVLDRVEGLARWFDEVAAQGGIGVNALLGGARAALAGRSAMWGALKGAVAGMSTPAKVALVTALVLAVLLLPLTVVLLLLALIVAAVVVAARSAGD
jgi:hypothetical protein